MTCPLTLTVDRSTGSSLSSPSQTDNMSSFQSSREQNERLQTNQVRAGRTNSIAQGSAPGTWRQPEMPSSIPNSSAYPSSQYDPNAPMMGYSPGNRGPQLVGENSVPRSTVCPGPVFAIPEQVQTAYSYGVRRPDGSYTRLLPPHRPAPVSLTRILNRAQAYTQSY